MIVNAYAVLDVFVSLLRFGLGLLVLGLGAWAWRAWLRRGPGLEDGKALEDRSHLLVLTAGILLVLNVISWPILYLLLQSYVPEFPGVMCIYGVTRVGAGGRGVVRLLPPLLQALQLTKPALVFLSGAWLVLYLVNRRTRTGPLTGRVLAVLFAAGLLAVGDAAAEVAYVAVPKKEEARSAGCCTEAFDAEGGADRYLPGTLVGDDKVPWLYAVYYAVNVGVALALFAYGRPGRRRDPRGWLAALLVAALLSVGVNAVFLVDAAAPRLLHLPYHHCPYDLVPKAPESLAAVALFLGGSFCVGWACVAGWLGAVPETRAIVPRTVRRLTRLALLGYLGSLVMLSVELALS
jgi:hypothetical protein